MPIIPAVATRLTRSFYRRPVIRVARALLGQRLVRVVDGQRLAGIIVETEAYLGLPDRAAHTYTGRRTARNASMWLDGGHAYIYFTYGMHHCLNVVTEREGYPAAVLIRALEPLEGIEEMRVRRGGCSDLPLTSGPARLCQALGIDRWFDGVDLCAPDALLFLEEDALIPDDNIATGPRIGVRGDEVAVTIPWRFYVRDSRYISR